jgi:TPR repeat protein
MFSRSYVAAALFAVICATPVISLAADGPSLYQQAIKVQNGEGTAVDLKAAQDLLEKAAAAGSTTAMQRLGDMFHDGDGGVKKDYAKAIEWYQKEVAYDGSHPGTGALGMIAIGESYEKGKGVKQDHNTANEWFTKALASAQIGAAKNDPAAMSALAYLLGQGKGVEKPDAVGAWGWIIKASQTPNPWAHELMASFYDRGIGVKADPSNAVANSLKAAQMGETRDMIDVSVRFATGDGVKKDEKVAVEWVQKAVDRGSSRAMALMGKYYHDGIGFKRSDTAAKEWYEKAINLGDEAALGYMGDMYIGPGVNQRDSKTAAKWFDEGATAGDTYSMFQLAGLLASDPDLVPDVNRAIKLFDQAAALGYVDAIAGLGELYRYRRISGITREESTETAITKFRKAAEAGSAMGMRDLGEMLTIKAEGATSDAKDDDKPLMSEAFDWLKRAADAGDLEALTDVGDAYQYGNGPSASASTAITWYRKAANAGNVRAMRNLGYLFMNNRVLTDYAEAKKWFEKGVEQNDGACISGLGEIYDNGFGVESNDGKAFELYRQAAKLGDAGGYRGVASYMQLAAANAAQAGALPLALDATQQAAAYYNRAAQMGEIRSMEALGRMFELGQGVEKNLDEAMRLFKRARDMGSVSAWNWVFSHEAISSTGSMGAGGVALPELMQLERLPVPIPRTTTRRGPGGPGGPGGFGPGGGGGPGGFGPGGGGPGRGPGQ